MGGFVENIKYAVAMRVLGWILIVLSIVEFGIGGAVYGFLTNIHLGAWWGAICCFIAGICGAISTTRASVITGCVFSIFAIIIAIVGSIVDGIASAILNGEKACVNTDTGHGWGSTSSQVTAAYCAYDWNSNAQTGAAPTAVSDAAAAKATQDFSLQRYSVYYNRPYYYSNNFFFNHPYWIFYYNQHHDVNWYTNHNYYYFTNHPYNRNVQYGDDTYFSNNNNNNYNNYFYYNGYFSGFRYQCICTDDTICYGYDLASGDNCGTILTTYSSLLSASTAFLSILCVVAFIYSIFTCISCSSSGTSSASTTPVVVQPVGQVQMTSVVPAPGVYVQPGMMVQQPVVYGAPQPGGFAAPVGYAPQGYAPVPQGYAPQMGYMPQQQQLAGGGQQPVMYAMAPMGGAGGATVVPLGAANAAAAPVMANANYARVGVAPSAGGAVVVGAGDDTKFV